ncbi:MAG: chemotaxis protein CheC [Roseiflexaceae bacterium]
MSEQISLWHQVLADVRPDSVLARAIRRAGDGLSYMIGQPVAAGAPRLVTLSIGEMADYAGDPEAEIVGIYLLLGDDLPGQAILTLPLADALLLVDALLGEPTGITYDLGDIERSALCEVGNLMVAYFLNEIALIAQAPLRPSPPAVMVDMLGAILEVVASAAPLQGKLLIIESELAIGESALRLPFWILPEHALR